MAHRTGLLSVIWLMGSLTACGPREGTFEPDPSVRVEPSEDGTELESTTPTGPGDQVPPPDTTGMAPSPELEPNQPSEEPPAKQDTPLEIVRALKLTLTQITDFPAIDETESTFTIYGRVVLRLESPNNIPATTELCEILVHTVDDEAQVTFPAQAFRGFPQVVSAARLPAVAPNSPIEIPQILLLAGWQAASPLTERMPEEEDDDRVLDADGDGHPGITIDMVEPIEGRVYIAVRTVLNLNGKFVDASRMEGQVAGLVDMALLGGSRGAIPDRSLRSTPVDDPTRNHFTMVALPDKDSSSCEAIRSLRTTLFPN